MNPRRQWLEAGGVRLHVRSHGSGRPCIYFHQSPLHSGSAHGLAAVLPHGWELWAPDTPGYGWSPALDAASPVTIERVAAAMAKVLRAADLGPAVLMGTHTGALLALEVARGNPALAHAVVLDGMPLFDEAERDDALEHYFPSYEPVWDGSHLARLWARAREQTLFFPWYARDAAHRMAYDSAEPTALHAWIRATLYAGAGYAGCYAAAFRYEARKALEAVEVPLKLLYRATDPLAAHRTRLPASWRTPGRCEVTAKAPADMWQAMAGQLTSWPSAVSLPARPRPTVRAAAAMPGLPVADDRAGREMLWTRRWPRPGARRLLLLHEVGRSGDTCVELAAALAADFEVVLPDLPGHGESDEVAPRLRAERVAQLLDGDARPTTIIAFGAHAGLACAVASAASPVAARLVLVDAPPGGTALTRWRASWCDDPQPSMHGEHLSSHWHRLRERHLFWPASSRSRDEVVGNCDALQPEALQAELVDALRCRPGVGQRWREALADDWRDHRPPIPVCCATSPRAVWWHEPADVRLASSATDARNAPQLLQASIRPVES